MQNRPCNLPWLDQWNIHVAGNDDPRQPGVPRLHERGRQAGIRHILELAGKRLEQVIRDCASADAWDAVTTTQASGWGGPTALVESNALTELHSLDRARHRLATVIQSLLRAQQHLDRIVARLASAGDHSAAYEKLLTFFPGESEALTAVDRALLEHAGALATRFEAPNLQHDFLAEVEADLTHLERALDQRALVCCRLLEASS